MLKEETFPYTNPFVFEKTSQEKEIGGKIIQIATEGVLDHLDLSDLHAETEWRQQAGAESKDIIFDVFFYNRKIAADIELQKYPEYFPLRARYYQAVNDTALIHKGTKYADLPFMITLFVCTFDPFGLGSQRYIAEERLFRKVISPETDITDQMDPRSGQAVYDAKYVKIYLNAGKAEDNEPGSELTNYLSYLRDGEAKDAFTRQIEARVKELNKKDRRELMTLNEMLEKEREQVRRQDELEMAAAVKKAEEEKTQAIVHRMHALGYPLKDIAEISGLNEMEAEKILAEDQTNPVIPGNVSKSA